jgi:hypothetical protein
VGQSGDEPVALRAALTRDNLTALLHAAGRGTRPGEADRLAEVFAAQLRQPRAVEAAMGTAVHAMVTSLAADDQAVRDLEQALAASLESHPDAEIIDSLPGLGLVFGARVLGEFGDDRTRWPDAASRRCYAGTAPIARTSGKSRVVLARYVRNRRLADACYLWAFSSLTKSPGCPRLLQPPTGCRRHPQQGAPPPRQQDPRASSTTASRRASHTTNSNPGPDQPPLLLDRQQAWGV